MKTKTIPFDLETAKKIQAGEIKGKIKTKKGKEARIICTDKASTDDDNRTQIVCLIRLGAKELVSINDPKTGECWDMEDGIPQHLVLEVPDTKPTVKVEETEKHEFKPFDKVLVRDSDEEEWTAAIFSHMTDLAQPYACVGNLYMYQCIAYEGNEHLVGTTDKPIF